MIIIMVMIIPTMPLIVACIYFIGNWDAKPNTEPCSIAVKAATLTISVLQLIFSIPT